MSEQTATTGTGQGADPNNVSWPFFAGIGWGGEHHQLCVVDTGGKKLTQQRLAHVVAGLAELDRHLLRYAPRMPIAIERSEGLLMEHLQAAGHAVYPVSPKISAHARERYKFLAVKDDRFDAFVLADTLRHEHEHSRVLPVPSPLLAKIKALTRDRDRLLETQQATEAQLRMILEAYHPTPVRLFSSVDRQIALSFIADYPTPATAGRIKATRMAGILACHHYTGRTPAPVLADRMRAHLLTGSAGTVAGKSCSAQTFARLLEMLNSQTGEYDDAIAAALGEHPDAPTFTSFPGVGPLLSAVLLAEIGEDRSRFPTAAVLLAEVGLAPVTRQSGRSSKVRFRYAANTRLREAAMWWAFNSMKRSPWAEDAFRQARDQRGQHYHRALCGLGARWMRVLWSCWMHHQPYDPARHGSAVAAAVQAAVTQEALTAAG